MGDRVMYLPMGELGDQGQAYLDGLENLDLVAIDDLEVLLEGAGSERSLFRLHNELLAGGGGLLLASERGPAELPVALADLSSRLAGGLVYRLKPLDTAQQSDALRQRARVNGLSLPEASARYLLARVDRSMASLCRWLDTLDREALASHRQLTVPFIRQVLRAAADGQNDQGDLGGRR